MVSTFWKVIRPASSAAAKAPALSEEYLEELRMYSGFEKSEIFRLHSTYQSYCTNNGDNTEVAMSLDSFLTIPGIQQNPLRGRICSIFGFDAKSTISFRQFLVGVAEFNCTARRDQLVKTAFRLHDLDNDGFISFEDIKGYLNLVSDSKLSDEETEELASQVFTESSLNREMKMNFSDFQRLIAPTDFHTKLRLPI